MTATNPVYDETSFYLLGSIGETNATLQALQDDFNALVAANSTDAERQAAVAALQAALGDKVDQSVYDTMVSGNSTDAERQAAVAALQASIDTNQNDLAQLQTDFNNVVAGNATDAELAAVQSALQAALGDKVDQSVYDAMVAGNATDAELASIQSTLQASIDATDTALGQLQTDFNDLVANNSTDAERQAAVATLQAALGDKVEQSVYDAMVAGNATDAELASVQTAIENAQAAIDAAQDAALQAHINDASMHRVMPVLNQIYDSSLLSSLTNEQRDTNNANQLYRWQDSLSNGDFVYNSSNGRFTAQRRFTAQITVWIRVTDATANDRASWYTLVQKRNSSGTIISNSNFSSAYIRDDISTYDDAGCGGSVNITFDVGDYFEIRTIRMSSQDQVDDNPANINQSNLRIEIWGLE